MNQVVIRRQKGQLGISPAGILSTVDSSHGTGQCGVCTAKAFLAAVAIAFCSTETVMAQEWSFSPGSPATIVSDDTWWGFDVSVGPDNTLTVTRCNRAWVAHELDLSGPISGGYTIVGIGNSSESPILENAQDWSLVTALTLPDTVTNIGANAFINLENCVNALVLPASIVSIGDNAFYGSAFRGPLAFPDSLVSVGREAFSGCTFTEMSSWGRFNTINEMMFRGVNFAMDVLAIPSQITSIEDFAFDSATFAGGVVIRDGVSFIGEGIFNGCLGLTKISLPSSGVTYSDYAFKQCADLEAVFYRGGICAENTLGIYSGCNFAVSYVRPEFVSEWNNETRYGNIQDVSTGIPDQWKTYPIYSAVWDWDNEYLAPAEMWVRVSTIGVETLGVTLTCDPEQLQPQFENATYVIYVSHDLGDADGWTPYAETVPGVSVTRNGSVHTLYIPYTVAGAPDGRAFFKVKAVMN